MPPKNCLKKMESESIKKILIDELQSLISYAKKIRKRIDELQDSEDGSLLKESNKEYKYIADAASELLQIMKKKSMTKEALNSSKRTVEKVKKEAQDLNKRLDEFEEKLMKYNIPYLNDSESFDNYLENIQEFMKIWKKEAEKGRAKGEKSLIEWLRQLDQSDHKERKTTFEALKDVVIDIGTQISVHLIEFFFLQLQAISGKREHVIHKLDDISILLGFLSVEEDSIVIKMFQSVIQFADRIMRESEKCSMVSVKNVWCNDTEADSIRMILQEILRLEVALCCPDLPMMLVDEVFLSMGSHLWKVFEKKLSFVNFKLQMELFSMDIGDEDLETLLPMKAKLIVGIKDIWNELDFQSC